MSVCQTKPLTKPICPLLRSRCPRFWRARKWDIVFYNAGVDPYEHDRLGRLKLSREGLRLRDRYVIETSRKMGFPVAGVLGGGYSTDIDELADRHVTLHRTAREVAALSLV